VWRRPSSVIDRLLDGVEIAGLVLTAEKRRSRFPEEHDYRASLSRQDCQAVFHIRVFDGRPPHYRPWIEVYMVPGRECFPRTVEDYILALASNALGPAGKLYFEYGWDPETLEELSRGVPAPVSRLGLQMVAHGFTWVRDWYHPEGFWEGGQKLAGEKPLTRGHARRHIEEAVREAREYVSRPTMYRSRVMARLRVLELLYGEGVPGAAPSGGGPSSPRRTP